VLFIEPMVAEHDAMAEDDDLAMRAMIPHLGVDLDLDTRDRLSDRADSPRAGIIRRDDGRGLRETIAFVDGDAERIDEFGDLTRKGSAAADDEAKRSTKLFSNALEDEAIKDAIEQINHAA